MSSDLKVTNIKHESSSSNNLVLGSDGSATINQISSSSVFPSTSPYFTFFHDIQWESDYTGHTVFKTVGTSVGPWQNKKASSQVFVQLGMQCAINHNTSGYATFARYAYGGLFYNSSSIAKGTTANSGSDTSNLGTEIGVHIIGRNDNTSNQSAGHEYIYNIFNGDFTSGSAGTNYYFHFAGKLDNSSLRLRTWDNGSGNDYPLTLKVIEIP